MAKIRAPDDGVQRKSKLAGAKKIYYGKTGDFIFTGKNAP
jgi:hypothetical protein